MTTDFALKDTDHQLVKDGYAFIVGDLARLYSSHFISGLMANLRARAAGNVNQVRNRLTVGNASYDAFEYGAHQAAAWWESLTDHLRSQYRL